MRRGSCPRLDPLQVEGRRGPGRRPAPGSFGTGRNWLRYKLMMDANQKWGVLEAIQRTKELAELDPWWMEEPTSPDDILGHARIRQEVSPIRIATGEHCHNRVMFKQFLQA